MYTMKKREFKTESKRVLDLMINSIYTNKEIFLRELISNASDALDKLYYLSLTNKDIKVKKNDLEIKIDLDKEARTLTITDNGCGMTEDELENNLGVIAESGSLHFKEENDGKDDVNIIGQFGVGFYSAFMVSDKVVVESKSYKEEDSHIWESTGVDGYTISKGKKETTGTKITLYLKKDTEDYSDFLTEYKIRSIIKKYSDYISYPIKMMVENTRKKEDSDEYETYTEEATLNSMVPLWKKDKKNIKTEEYNNFYQDRFHDYEEPLKVLHFNMEGNVNFTALLFIPSHAPYDFYSKEYEKGLALYTNGVLIMDKCSDLLPDYFSFVKGVIDTEDIPLNIVYEDKYVMVVNKPAGLVVHPGHGNYHGTLVNALAWHMKDVPDYDANDPHVGLVHRIDKDTSGLLVIAKTPDAKTNLGLQFFNKTTKRKYRALVWGTVEQDEGTIVGNIARNPKDRMQMAVMSDPAVGKHAVTHYRVLERLGYVTLVECILETGRTHQIRVHMKHIGHVLFNDERYGGHEILKGTHFSKYKQFVNNCFDTCPRQALHAMTLGFVHPVTGEEMYFTSELPDDMARLIEKWRGYISNRELE